jgi:hypothetical protein
MNATALRQPTPLVRPRTPARTAIGVLLAIVAAVGVLAGIALIAVHAGNRDGEGYFSSSTASVATAGYAITSDEFAVGTLDDGVAGRVATDLVDRARLTATSENGKPLFVGIAPASAVSDYLGEVQRREVTDVPSDGQVSSHAISGGSPAGLPADQSFWRASSSGPGKQAADWDVRDGHWSMVVMNADGSASVSAGLSVAAQTNLLLWLGVAFLGVGVLVAGAAGASLYSRSR